METYIINGIQIDGEHEYYIHSIIQQNKNMTDEIAARILMENHAFGYDQDDENNDPNDPNFNYGDGLTNIKLLSFSEITKEQFNVLRELGLP